jgi:tetratricopeptide (TPR) repeat protein
MNIAMVRLGCQHLFRSSPRGVATLLLLTWFSTVTIGAEPKPFPSVDASLNDSFNSDIWQPLEQKEEARYQTYRPFQPIRPNTSRNDNDLDRDIARLNSLREDPSASNTPDGSSTYSSDSHQRTEDFEPFNLRVGLPDGQWRRIKSPTSGKEACLLLVRMNPEMGIVVVAEQLRPEVKFSDATLLTVSQERILGKYPDAVFGQKTTAEAAGITGVQYEARMTRGPEQMFSDNWIAAHNGYIYQVMIFGRTADASLVAATARQFRSDLQLIDPNRVADCPKLAASKRSTAFGYQIDLTDLGWLAIDRDKTVLEVTEFAAMDGNGNLIVISAIPLPGRAANLEHLKKAFLAHSSFGREGDEVVRTLPYRAGNWQCEEIHAWRVLNGERTPYCMRIIAGQHCAYYLVGWQLHGNEKTLDPLRSALNRFTILADNPVEQANLNQGQQLYSGLTLNDVGLACYKSGDYLAAADFFNLARKMSPRDPAITDNYLEVLVRLDRADEALAALAEVPAEIRNTPPFRALQARLLERKGDGQEAGKMYQQLFADGCTDEATLVEYVGSCVSKERYDDALTAVEAVLKRKPTLTVERLQATLYS